MSTERSRRGRYDRTLSPSERAKQHRAAIRSSALSLLASAPTPLVNVDELCRNTHLGRNTVYGLFETSSQLATVVLDEALAEFFQALQRREVSTPIDDLRSFAGDWLKAAQHHRTALGALLSWRRPQLREQLCARLRLELTRGVAAGAFAPDALGARLPYLAELFLAAADPELQRALGSSPAKLDETLVELALRLVR